ncbi:hypothetical protein ScPMuIL_004749 [Solemya velum]
MDERTVAYIHLLTQYSDIEEVQFVKKKESVKIEEIGDGNLNDVFRLYSESGPGSVILKHGPPYIKCIGPEYPLGIYRTKLEFDALTKFDELSPGSVPKPFLFDRESNVICMEDLRSYRIFRKLLINRQLSMAAARSFARHIAVIHRKTHVAELGHQGIKVLNEQFSNPELVALTANFILTAPFIPNEPTNRCSEAVKKQLHTVQENQKVKDAVEVMKKLFLEKKESLVHGDFHTGSVMVDGDTAKIIDLEFAYVGPCAVDIGLLIANYIFSYYRHMSIPQDNDAGRQFAYKMIEVCHMTVRTYLEEMTCTVGDKESYQDNLLSEVAGFTGCELVRRIVGVAHVEDIDDLPSAQVEALGAGVRLLEAYHRIHTIDRLMVIALMLL